MSETSATAPDPKFGREPLPCFACGSKLWQIAADDRHTPSEGTMFDAGPGHYGSTVWDEMTSGRSLSINVCDPCLIKHADRVAEVNSFTPPPRVVFNPWKPPAEDAS